MSEKMRFGPQPEWRAGCEPEGASADLPVNIVTEREPFFKEVAPARKKGVHIGAPACFALELACKHVRSAFADQCKIAGIYIVGSVLERADWRDVDVRLMMDDESFQVLFPDAALHSAAWEHDPRWTLMTIAISQWMRTQTGLPIDFQFQPMTFANERHKGPRNAAGIRYVK